MRSLTRALAVVAAGCALLLPGADALAKTYPPPVSQGEGSADPSRVGVGECTTFSGGGFRPLSDVRVSDDGHFVRTVSADVQGNFSAQVCFNSDAKPGKHTLEGDGVTTAGQQRVVTAVVYVLGSSHSHGGNGNGNGGGNGGGNGNGKGGGKTKAAASTNTAFYRSAAGWDVGLIAVVVAIGVASIAILRAERRYRRRRREATTG